MSFVSTDHRYMMVTVKASGLVTETFPTAVERLQGAITSLRAETWDGNGVAALLEKMAKAERERQKKENRSEAAFKREAFKREKKQVADAMLRARGEK